MLGRKDYTKDEVDHARRAVDRQLAAYKKLVKASDGATSDAKVVAARAAFEPLFFGNMVLALDRFFVHRIRAVAGKDCNPLNEVELLVEALLNHDGVLHGNKVIKYVPAQTVLKLEIGDQIRLDPAQFERLANAFFAEIEAKFM